MSKLTVVVPLYNTEKYIGECINSIQNQSFREIDIIIVNDGSTDNGPQICYELAKNDSRIQIIHQDNKGLAGARFTGLKNCKTEYVTFVDADDFILQDSYINALKYMDKKIDMIFFEIARYFDEHNVKTAKHILESGFYDRKRIETEVYPKLIWNFERNTPGIECSQCVRITKTELLRNMYEELDTNLYYGEDIAITYPLYKKINTMQVVPKCYYMHRQRKMECASYIKSNDFFEETFVLYKRLINEFCPNEENNIFRRQIEYLFIHANELKKIKYNDFDDENGRFLFPFDKVPYGRNILLYGAGEMGHVFYNQLSKLNYCKELLWVDKNAEYMNDNRIVSISEINSKKIDFAVIAIENKIICKTVQDLLVEKNIGLNKIIF
ncbi:MAG: glycosyltransferase family 2 protein [Lachnospiraceae bacterium]|nr:glycosyltransferase family 2 protein [Lachnospiraceae bacterium]